MTARDVARFPELLRKIGAATVSESDIARANHVADREMATIRERVKAYNEKAETFNG